MFKKISSYWKCQLLGWLIFVLISYVFNNIIYQDFTGFFYKAVIIFSFGMFFSHLLKLAIRKAGILEKKFVLQIIYSISLVVIFSSVGTYVWMITLLKTGIWNEKELRESTPGISFYQVYFYNLFIILLTLSAWNLIYILVHYVRDIKKEVQLKMQYKLQTVELEAKALRAQMNPHFIFNCMNSIKSLIQKNDNEKAIAYLTTFSKLMRTVFQNSSKKEITLNDEIETCRLYTHLESMRFGNKFSYEFNVDETLDLKSIMVPALIMQPFIENAIWHGIMPKEDGGNLRVEVMQDDHTIKCIVDDDGIGRETSRQNKFPTADYVHESKGEHLTQARLDLDNLLNERDAGLKIIDKKNDIDKAAGTTVILSFKEE